MPRRGKRRDLCDRGTTTQRGLGWEHRQQRARLLVDLVEGTPCGWCGYGMYRWQALDADHPTPRAFGMGGHADRLLHASCNRSRGARLASRLRRRVTIVSRNW